MWLYDWDKQSSRWAIRYCINVIREHCKRIQNGKGAVVIYIITLKRENLYQPAVCNMSDVIVSSQLPALSLRIARSCNEHAGRNITSNKLWKSMEHVPFKPVCWSNIRCYFRCFYSFVCNIYSDRFCKTSLSSAFPTPKIYSQCYYWA